jgi:hypothetical protein
MGELVLFSETVEKPENWDFDTRKLLISLHAKLLNSPLLDFFDSLSINLHLAEFWF